MNEEKLFDYIKAKYIDDLKPTQGYCSFDGYSIKYQALVELKCRAKHYDDMMIEQQKYNALMRDADTFGFVVYYVCSTPKGIYCWSLLTIKAPVWYENETMPKSTAFDDKSVTSKAVGYLGIDSSTRL